jgi:hypothetical protein
MASVRHVTAGSVAQGTNVIKETANRTIGLLEAAARLVGFRPYKKLRLRVVILRDEDGAPLCGEGDVLPSIRVAQEIFSWQAHVRVVPAAPAVLTVSDPAPKAALDVHCDDGAWQEDFDVAGAFFRRFEARTRSGSLTGYGAPVTVFIVRDISNKGGCSLGPLTNYVTLEAKMLDRAQFRLLAHEVAHACGLWHSKVKSNLMFPKGPGADLTWWQETVLRNSRHVTLA